MGELLALLQWVPADEMDRELRREDGRLAESLADEIANVGIYLLLLADALGIDLLDAINAKLARNATRYPVERSWGRPDKYDLLGGHGA